MYSFPADDANRAYVQIQSNLNGTSLPVRPGYLGVGFTTKESLYLKNIDILCGVPSILLKRGPERASTSLDA